MCIQKYLLISEYDSYSFPFMKTDPKRDPKTERINLCLRRKDREHLESIARREDRDLGYLCSWFVEWGMEQYEKLGLSLVELKDVKVVRDKLVQKWVKERLALRGEAQRLHEELSDSSSERKRA